MYNRVEERRKSGELERKRDGREERLNREKRENIHKETVLQILQYSR